MTVYVWLAVLTKSGPSVNMGVMGPPKADASADASGTVAIAPRQTKDGSHVALKPKAVLQRHC